MLLENFEHPEGSIDESNIETNDSLSTGSSEHSSDKSKSPAHDVPDSPFRKPLHTASESSSQNSKKSHFGTNNFPLHKSPRSRFPHQNSPRPRRLKTFLLLSSSSSSKDDQDEISSNKRSCDLMSPDKDVAQRYMFGFS